MPGPRLSRKRLSAVQWRAAHVRPLQGGARLIQALQGGGVPDAPRADAGIRPYKAHKKADAVFRSVCCYVLLPCRQRKHEPAPVALLALGVDLAAGKVD